MVGQIDLSFYDNFLGPNSEPPNKEILFEDGHSAPLESEIEIKEEPLNLEDSPMPLQTLEGDVELPDLENSEHPIEQGSSQLSVPLKESTQIKDNELCRFCLQFILEEDAQTFVLRRRVVSVLGISTSKFFTPAVTIKCCKRCKELIDQFYEFKQMSVVALAQSEKHLATFAGHRKTQLATQTTKIASNDADEANTLTSPPPSGTDMGIPSPELNPVPTAEDPYNCGRCTKRFATETCYVRHKPFCTKESKTRDKSPKRPMILMQCPQCPKKFRNPKTFTLHTNWHNGIRTIPCQHEGCNKMFFTTYDCHKHEEICGQDDAKVLCNICGSLFLTEAYLRQHLTIHEDPQFRCEVCHKRFRSKYALIKHAPVHSGERKFECKVCGKRFKSREANRVHQRIHTHQKPYACQACGERFRLNCLLKAHVGKVHGPGQEPKEAQSKSEMQ